MTDPNASIEYLDDPAIGGSVPLLDAGQANDVLRDAKRIAIVGASPNPWRASNTVMSYLMSRGYECVPVNPNVGSVLGRPSFPSLEAASAGSGGAPFDIVDVFRRPEFAPDIARSAVTLGAGTLCCSKGCSAGKRRRSLTMEVSVWSWIAVPLSTTDTSARPRASGCA